MATKRPENGSDEHNSSASSRSSELDEPSSDAQHASQQGEGSESNNLNRKDSVRSKALITMEIEKYIEEPLWPRSSDLMVWWADHGPEYKK